MVMVVFTRTQERRVVSGYLGGTRESLMYCKAYYRHAPLHDEAHVMVPHHPHMVVEGGDEGVHVRKVRKPHIVELGPRRVVAPAVLQHSKQLRHVGLMPESLLEDRR